MPPEHCAPGTLCPRNTPTCGTMIHAMPGSDAHITPPDLVAGLKRYTHQEIALDEAEQILLFSKHDSDADGRISFEEFVEFMSIDDQHKSSGAAAAPQAAPPTGAAKVHPEVPIFPQ